MSSGGGPWVDKDIEAMGLVRTRRCASASEHRAEGGGGQGKAVLWSRGRGGDTAWREGGLYTSLIHDPLAALQHAAAHKV